MAAVRHLDLIGIHLDHTQRVLGGVYHCAKFGYDRCSSFDNMNVSIFGAFGWKEPIHASKIGVLSYLTPTWAAILTKVKKASASSEPSSVKIWREV